MIKRLENIMPGQIVCYWEGAAISKAGPETIAIRNAAYAAWLEDRIELIQQRIGEMGATGEFRYIAIGKKCPPNPEAVSRRLAREHVLRLGIDWRKRH